MNFNYSPGLYGYGVKGADGSMGIQGMGIYYTDFNLIQDIDILTNKIQRNETLYSIDPSGKTLPEGRTYLNYEFIVNDRGEICIITNVSTGEYSDPPFIRFATVNYFEDTSIRTDTGYQRYYNIHSDPSLPYYIIDNVYNVKRGSYLTYPNKIYGIHLKNFNRIEFSNSDRNRFNPFTIYSSGQFRYVDDKKSMAIVRSIDDNQFRIGNLQNFIVNDVDIIFDVSLLQKNSYSVNINSPKGEVLSNYEANYQSLYNGIFLESPDSLYALTSGSSTLIIYWKLSDITHDTNIHADLNLCKRPADAPISEYIIHDIGPEGSINFTNVSSNEIYEYYISITKNGWTRNTLRKQYVIGSTPVLEIINPPHPHTLTASVTGEINGQSTYEVDLSTNSTTGWSLSNIPSWITCTPTSATTYSDNEHFTIKVASNSGGNTRTSNIYVDSQAPRKTITVFQTGYTDITLTINPMLTTFKSNMELCPGHGTIQVSANTVEPYTWRISKVVQTQGNITQFFVYSPTTAQTGNGTIQIIPKKANNFPTQRMAEVTIEYYLDGAPKEKIFYVKQYAQGEECYVE